MTTLEIAAAAAAQSYLDGRYAIDREPSLDGLLEIEGEGDWSDVAADWSEAAEALTAAYGAASQVDHLGVLLDHIAASCRTEADADLYRSADADGVLGERTMWTGLTGGPVSDREWAALRQAAELYVARRSP